MDAAIETAALTCRYGRHEAVHDVTFSVRSSSIFALLGPNGAGKTTIIRVLMNMLRPAAGSARVLGIESIRLVASELGRIGYVSENQKLPRWMTVRALLAFCRPFYPTWDSDFANALAREFQLPMDVRIGHLSRGMRVKAALVSALAFRPRLLVLDEPFSGLDPVVRDDLIHGVLELAGEQDWTVFISSHDLDEVERLVDDIGFLNEGRLLLTEPLSELQRRFRRIEVTLPEPARRSEHESREPGIEEHRARTAASPGTAAAPFPEHWLGLTTAGRVLRFVDRQYSDGDSERQVLSLFPGAQIAAAPLTLREMFVALVRHERSRAAEVSR